MHLHASQPGIVERSWHAASSSNSENCSHWPIGASRSGSSQVFALSMLPKLRIKDSKPGKHTECMADT